MKWWMNKRKNPWQINIWIVEWTKWWIDELDNCTKWLKDRIKVLMKNK